LLKNIEFFQQCTEMILLTTKKNYFSSNTQIFVVENFDFLKNGKQGVQTVRLDELNNIFTGANISFIFKS